MDTVGMDRGVAAWSPWTLGCMRLRPLIVTLALAALVPALAQDKPAETPTWQDMLALGIVPYRQLTVEDFPVNDTAHAKHAFHIKTAIEPRYHFILKPHTTGFVYAYIDQWIVSPACAKPRPLEKANSRR